ncbi:MAG: restriction endonuclease subunit S [Polyangiaceae bacterium]|nr:restriction endonuclease subunit S [Polyangiaceae bacterium]
MPIPNEGRWPYRTIGELCTRISRGTAPRYVERSPVLAIGQRCVTHGGFDPTYARPHSGLTVSGVLAPETNDVLLNSTGTGTIGRSCVFDGSGRFIVDGHVTVLRPTGGQTDGRWLNALLRTPWSQRHLETRCYSGSTNQVELSGRDLAATQVPLPPLLEQYQIAAIIDTVDDTIRKSEELIAKLEQVKQGLLHDLLTRGMDDNGELRDPERHPEQFEDSPLGRIPKGWSCRRLKDLSPRLAGRLIVQPHQYFSTEGVPIVFGSDIRPGWIDQTGIKRISAKADARFAHCRVRAGDLLTVRVGVPGMSAVVPPELDGCHFASTMLIRRADSFDSHWLCFCMNSSFVRRQIESANYGSVQTQFNIGDAAGFVLPVPPAPEQRQVVDRLEAFRRRIRADQSALRKFRLLKSGIMEDLLTGRVRVTPLLESAPA